MSFSTTGVLFGTSLEIREGSINIEDAAPGQVLPHIQESGQTCLNQITSSRKAGTLKFIEIVFEDLTFLKAAPEQLIVIPDFGIRPIHTVRPGMYVLGIGGPIKVIKQNVWHISAPVVILNTTGRCFVASGILCAGYYQT